jgi:PhzF family phenazine biosynthesis protein
MPARPFDIVDVFTTEVGRGNPVAVVHDAHGLDADRMQRIAHWFGLPETVFVLGDDDPHADYSVRIFAPICELPFAGHPSIGAAAAMLARGRKPMRDATWIQRCPGGLVKLVMTGDLQDPLISFETPAPSRVRPLGHDDLACALRSLGLTTSPAEAAIAFAGATWIILRFDDPAAVAAAAPNLADVLPLSKRLGVSGITIFGPSADQGARIEVRSFAPAIGVAEDAVCGGGNACVAATLAASAREGAAALRYVASQGRHLGRAGRVHVEGPFDDRRFRVGGHSRLAATGMLNL